MIGRGDYKNLRLKDIAGTINSIQNMSNSCANTVYASTLKKYWREKECNYLSTNIKSILINQLKESNLE